MRKFKKGILDLLFDHYDKFYLHIAPLKRVFIGRRGFVGDEQKNGLVLVFGPNSYKTLQWDEEYMYLDMKFSGKWESIVIPFDAIVAAFDDPARPSFIMRFTIDQDETGSLDETHRSKRENGKPSKRVKSTRDNVVKVDFSKKGD